MDVYHSEKEWGCELDFLLCSMLFNVWFFFDSFVSFTFISKFHRSEPELSYYRTDLRCCHLSNYEFVITHYLLRLLLSVQLHYDLLLSTQVIIGGIKSPNDFFPTPRPETTLDILRRGVRLCPELLHPPPPTASTDSAYTPTTTLTPDALDNLSDTDFLNLVEPFIIEAGCGLRPARKGGLRLEVEWIVQSSTESAPQIPLVHNYGHAGSGFQSSWGSATRAMSLLEGALQD